MGVGVQGEAGAVMPQHTRDGLDVQSTRIPEFSCSRMACFQRENGLRIFPAPDPNPGPIQGSRKEWPARLPMPQTAAHNPKAARSGAEVFHCTDLCILVF